MLPVGFASCSDLRSLSSRLPASGVRRSVLVVPIGRTIVLLACGQCDTHHACLWSIRNPLDASVHGKWLKRGMTQLVSSWLAEGFVAQ